MRPRMRIQAKARWAEEASAAPVPRPAPPSAQSKLLAVAGIVLFWCYFFGWVGAGGRDGLETGFALFIAMQIPLLWTWLRGQIAGRG